MWHHEFEFSHKAVAHRKTSKTSSQRNGVGKWCLWFPWENDRSLTWRSLDWCRWNFCRCREGSWGSRIWMMSYSSACQAWLKSRLFWWDWNHYIGLRARALLRKQPKMFSNGFMPYCPPAPEGCTAPKRWSLAICRPTTELYTSSLLIKDMREGIREIKVGKLQPLLSEFLTRPQTQIKIIIEIALS